jgi:hypothetical protein
MSWTISWDLHRRPGTGRESTASEPTEREALQRAKRFLQLGFVVYGVRNPAGAIVMDEQQLTAHFALVHHGSGT